MIYTTEKILEKMLPVIKKYQIREVILFGSYARGEATPNSDIDLAINYGDKCRGLSCIAFLSEVEGVLDKPVDAVSLRQIPYYLIEPIKKEGVLLYESHRQRDHDLERNYEILQRH